MIVCSLVLHVDVRSPDQVSYMVHGCFGVNRICREKKRAKPYTVYIQLEDSGLNILLWHCSSLEKGTMVYCTCSICDLKCLLWLCKLALLCSLATTARLFKTRARYFAIPQSLCQYTVPLPVHSPFVSTLLAKGLCTGKAILLTTEGLMDCCLTGRESATNIGYL